MLLVLSYFSFRYLIFPRSVDLWCLLGIQYFSTHTALLHLFLMQLPIQATPVSIGSPLGCHRLGSWWAPGVQRLAAFYLLHWRVFLPILIVSSLVHIRIAFMYLVVPTCVTLGSGFGLMSVCLFDHFRAFCIFSILFAYLQPVSHHYHYSCFCLFYVVSLYKLLSFVILASVYVI